MRAIDESARAVTFTKTSSTQHVSYASNDDSKFNDSAENSNFSMTGPRPLLYRRSSSVSLFAKPAPLIPKNPLEYSNDHISLTNDTMGGNILDTTIYQSQELGAASSEIEVKVGKLSF